MVLSLNSFIHIPFDSGDDSSINKSGVASAISTTASTPKSTIYHGHVM